MPSSPSTHLTDPSLAPFLSPTFSPIAYLNSTLPNRPSTTKASQNTSQTSTNKSPPQSLSVLASQTQSQISTLSARTATLSSTLTALTDDILRCSSRLTYEVELLRGEAVGLGEAMTAEDGELGDAIRRFVPEGLNVKEVGLDGEEKETVSPQKPGNHASGNQKTLDGTDEEAQTKQAIERLRTLLHVKSLLQQTTQTFSSALSFPLPPSMLASTGLSLISVNPPSSDPNAEEKGQTALANLRREIADLLAMDDGPRVSEEEPVGLRKARERVAELREVTGVWKGTSEEKARTKVVEGLDGMVEEAVNKRRKSLETQRPTINGARSSGTGSRREPSDARATGSGRGFLGNLQRLREEIYME